MRGWIIFAIIIVLIATGLIVPVTISLVVLYGFYKLVFNYD